MLAELGLEPQPKATIIGYVGNGVRRLVERTVRVAGGSSDGPLVGDALGIFLARYGAHLLDTTVAYPGIAAVVTRLREAGVELSVATNKPEAMALEILTGLGLAEAFAAVLGGDSLQTHKPDPAIVHTLVQRAGVPRGQTLLVGDSPVDVATARAAGVAVCAVTWGLTPAAVLLAEGPDFAVSRPQELLELRPVAARH